MDDNSPEHPVFGWRRFLRPSTLGTIGTILMTLGGFGWDWSDQERVRLPAEVLLISGFGLVAIEMIVFFRRRPSEIWSFLGGIVLMVSIVAGTIGLTYLAARYGVPFVQALIH